MQSVRPAIKLDFALSDAIREGLGCRSESKPVMGGKIISLPNQDAERVRRMTARMAAGDETAFRDFYECYCDRLFRYLLVLTRGNEDLARDLLQSTMTKIVRSGREFRDEGQLWNWLAVVTRNCFIDALRRTRRAPQLVPLLPDDAAEMPLAPTDESDALLFDALDRCLTELSVDERALIEAFYFNGGSHQPVAKQENTTPKPLKRNRTR